MLDDSTSLTSSLSPLVGRRDILPLKRGCFSIPICRGCRGRGKEASVRGSIAFTVPGLGLTGVRVRRWDGFAGLPITCLPSWLRLIVEVWVS